MKIHRVEAELLLPNRQKMTWLIDFFFLISLKMHQI